MVSGRHRAEETTALRATTSDSAGRKSSGRALHVVREGRVLSFYLEPGKTLLIGRSHDADICIDEPSVSRRHLRLEVGADVVAEDLGSANGVRVGSQTLKPGERMVIEPGVVIEVGSAMLVVQRSVGAAPPRRVWSHSYFEGRVQDECARAERLSGKFAVLRVRVVNKDAATRLVDALSSDLGASDVLAEYGPGELEALLVEPWSDDANEIAKRSVALLTDRGLEGASAGAASYPNDGRAADTLMATAGERLAPRRDRPPRKAGRATYGAHLAEIEKRLRPIARSDISVLVTGETGVGKELVAEMVHELSNRAGKPFLRLNCGAFSEPLLESELFGHERGAFTGADRSKAGLLESADGGTVFLDEIGELPLGLQPKLLRVVEAGEALRVGGLRPKRIDVRFVAATNRDLENEAQLGKFRKDLYFRLAGHTETILPLRERPGDIALLAEGLLADAARAAGVRAPAICDAATALLAAYSWPGNVRELRNVMQRALLLAEGGDIQVEHLGPDKLTMRVLLPSPAPDKTSLEAALSAHEKQRIVDELARCGGNQTHAAKALGMSRGTLLSRLDAFGLARPRKHD
jgi:two-component system, NtrC family, response regulator AtoC